MSEFVLFLLLVFTFGISWWNAVVAGKIWPETKVLGGFMRLVAWSAAVQSACGFTMVFAFLLAGISYAFGIIGTKPMELMMHLTYLLIILPVLGSGLIITIHSWIIAYRERNFLDMGIATYNTLAMTHNAYGAVDGIGEALSAVTKSFSSDDDDDKAGIVIILVALALGAGIMLTYCIIQKYAGTMALPVRESAKA